MNTFPQIFLNQSNKLSKIGGLEELNNLVMVCEIIKKYKFTQKELSYIKKLI